MLVTFRHDGTGFRPAAATSVAVEIAAAAHTYHAGQRMTGRNWLVWPPLAETGPYHADTFAEAVHAAADDAAALMGGVVLATVAGVAVPSGWDAVALLSESAQADPPFSDWPEVLDRAHPDADADDRADCPVCGHWPEWACCCC
ncbi:MAG: hypothetical protein OXU74_06525 [Gemmatimonadota bacterium]|nr:hypothetical protein [Gemmatimonadota bacterium]